MMAASSRWWPRLVARVGHLIDRLYRWRLGWLFAHRFAVLTHVGRRSGKTYRTALWVYGYQPDTGKVTVVSVWGESDWYRNIRNKPATLMQIGRHSIVPGQQQFLSTDDIVAIEKAFRREHPWIARGQALVMHWPWPATDEQLKTMSNNMRAVTFSPAP
jgi:deazaflavin-dependent oxidoreductase (nitroreductase family)